MRFVDFESVAGQLRGRRVAIVGSGPSCLANAPGFVDGHEVVVRVNNYKLGEGPGARCDVHYSFYGTSIRKAAAELLADGVRLCMCKCPDGKPIESAWHERNNKQVGIDYRYIYRNRAAWWFCDTFVPEAPRYMEKFYLLERHIPTTGFAAILDVLACEPAEIYLTGFDFFESGVHNVDEPWPGREKNYDDPIRHRPDLEAHWLARNARRHPFVLDAELRRRLYR